MPPHGFAQSLTAVGLMPQPGAMVSLSPAFTPAHLWGMAIHPDDPFKFDFLIQRGDVGFTDDQKRIEYSKLIKYFLAALAVPDTDQWVNLSPYEKDRIVPDGFGLTEMGRDLLAQDYLLKQLSSSLTDPGTELGKKFWNGIYQEAYKRFGTADIPTDTFNKVWILPDKAVVFEKDNAVYVLESHLKVMTEKDYLAMKNNVVGDVSSEAIEISTISSQMLKEVIIPVIEKEVNEGKGFAPLRQVYSGMLLATWYKRSLKESILGKLYADKGKVKGVDQDPKNNQEIYGQYVQAFKKGVFNMIKEDVDRYTHEVIPRKYFSGGTENDFAAVTTKEENEPKALQGINSKIANADVVVSVLNKSRGAINWVKSTSKTVSLVTLVAAFLFVTGCTSLLGEKEKTLSVSEIAAYGGFDKMKFVKVAKGPARVRIITKELASHDLYVVLTNKDQMSWDYTMPSDGRMNVEFPVLEDALKQTESQGMKSDANTINQIRLYDSQMRAMGAVPKYWTYTVGGYNMDVIRLGVSWSNKTAVCQFTPEGIDYIDNDYIDNLDEAELTKADKAGVVDNSANNDDINIAQRETKENTGGIDLAQSNLNMEIRRDGAGIPLPISQQNLDNIQIDGLVPVILNIQPAANVPMFSQAGGATPSAV
jgi:hypothetical protein